MFGSFELGWQPRAVMMSRRFGVMGFDTCLAGLSLVLAVLFRFGGEVAPVMGDLPIVVPLFMLLCLISFHVVGFYNRLWRYSSISELVVIAQGVTLAAGAFTLTMFLATRLESFPRSVIAIDWFILVIFLGGSRLLLRLASSGGRGLGGAHRPPRDARALPVLLVGAENGADLFLRAWLHDRRSTLRPIAILDDDPRKHGMSLHGVPVLGGSKDFQGVFEQLAAKGVRPRHLIFTERHQDGGAAMKYLVSEAEKLGVATSRLSLPTELRRSPDHATSDEIEVRPIELADLLPRPQAVLDREAIARFIRGRRVLVTGAGGSIGGELTHQVATLAPAELVLVEASEFNLYTIELELSERSPQTARRAYLCNVRDLDRLDQIFRLHRPEIVFHAAALKHVPLVEANVAEGVLTNVLGTVNVIECARRHRAQAMVQVSSDKVVNSTSAMGATKRLAELYCQALDLAQLEEPGEGTRFMTVRFGNVLGSSGSLIPLFSRQLARGGPLTITHPDMKRYFMTIREAVELILQASASGHEQQIGHGQIFVLDMGEPIKIVDIARWMIKLAGYTPDVDIQLKITGIRPGEKLFEELFDAEETPIDTGIPGILGARPSPRPLAALQEAFEAMAWAARQGDESELRRLIAEILPSFRISAEPTGAPAALGTLPEALPARPAAPKPSPPCIQDKEIVNAGRG